MAVNGGRNNDNNCVFYIFGDAIPSVQVVKDLELNIDSNHSSDQHCLNTVKELSQIVWYIFRNFKTSNAELPC